MNWEAEVRAKAFQSYPLGMRDALYEEQVLDLISRARAEERAATIEECAQVARHNYAKGFSSNDEEDIRAMKVVL